MNQFEQEKAGLARTLHHLRDAGWEPHSANDGEDLIRFDEGVLIDKVVEVCSDVDICHLFFRNGTLKGMVLLVWGNSPEELIADMSTNNGFDMAVDLATTKAFPEPAQVPTVEELVQQAGGDYWASHEKYPREDWQLEVANGDTQRGYWDWVIANFQSGL